MKSAKRIQSVVDLASAFYGSSVLFAALEHGVFAALAKQPGIDAETLARTLGTHSRGMRLLLDGCVALDLLRKDGGNYSNTWAAAMCLVPGAPHDLTRAIRYNQDVYPAWGRLSELVRTGDPVEPPALHLGADSERTRRFVLSMHARALGIGRSVLPMLDLAGAERLLDVGGGPGTYAVLMAEAQPELHCTLLDLPPVVAVAEELIAHSSAAERVLALSGDYHQTPFPDAQDIVTFFGVLHQESPDAIRDLLRRAYDVLRPGGQVWVLDPMTDASHTRPSFAALFAINMALTTTHGWVFAREELGAWLKEAGFGELSFQPAPPPMPHVLARAVKPRQGGR